MALAGREPDWLPAMGPSKGGVLVPTTTCWRNKTNPWGVGQKCSQPSDPEGSSGLCEGCQIELRQVSPLHVTNAESPAELKAS